MIFNSPKGAVLNLQGCKFQEKITSINKINNSCIFQLCKNNGKINCKRNQVQYETNDNQFYWLNCDNKKTFFVVPEEILIDKGYVLKIMSSRPKEVILPWLKKHELDSYIDEVSNHKFPATVYIDDRGYCFVNWISTLKDLESHPKIKK